MRTERTPLDLLIVRPLWIVVAAILLAIALWPALCGFRAANDDVKWVRSPDIALGITAAMAKAWDSEASFRPLEVAVAHLCDPESLRCTAAITAQLLGLAAIVSLVPIICRACVPRHQNAAMIALCFLAISPATTCSVWQMDSCSQTWTAALGALGALVAWRALRQHVAGAVDLRRMAGLTAIFLVGCSLKETFYGWSAGIGIAVISAGVFTWPRDRRAAARISLLLLPTVIVPVAHLLARLRFGALGERMVDADGSRYQAELGVNVIVNAAMSVAGILGAGPFHLATDQSAPLPLRLLPYVAVAASMFIILGAVTLGLIGRRVPAGVDVAAIAFIGGACCLSVSATIPMGSVSELYGFGANIGAALVVAGATCVLWANDVPDERLIARATAVSCAIAFFCIGAYGLGSRALHFRAVWHATDSVNRAILEFQDRVAPPAEGSGAPAGIVRFGAGCLLTRTYGQYVMPPAQAINLEATAPWLARRRPDRPIGFVIGSGTGAGPPGERELVLDCKDSIDHGHW